MLRNAFQVLDSIVPTGSKTRLNLPSMGDDGSQLRSAICLARHPTEASSAATSAQVLPARQSRLQARTRARSATHSQETVRLRES